MLLSKILTNLKLKIFRLGTDVASTRSRSSPSHQRVVQQEEKPRYWLDLTILLPLSMPIPTQGASLVATLTLSMLSMSNVLVRKRISTLTKERRRETQFVYNAKHLQRTRMLKSSPLQSVSVEFSMIQPRVLPTGSTTTWR